MAVGMSPALQLAGQPAISRPVYKFRLCSLSPATRARTVIVSDNFTGPKLRQTQVKITEQIDNRKGPSQPKGLTVPPKTALLILSSDFLKPSKFSEHYG